MFHCEPVGATATLVAEQFFLHEIDPPPPIAAGLLAGILSDTLAFASPTCSEKDRRMARRLETLAGLDSDAFARELMAARGDVAIRPATELIEADFKEFNLAGHRVGIAQIEAPEVMPLLARRDEIFEALRRAKENEGAPAVDSAHHRRRQEREPRVVHRRSP